MTNEIVFSAAQSTRSKAPETHVAGARHHGMEKSPAPRMLLVRLRHEGKISAVAAVSSPPRFALSAPPAALGRSAAVP